MWEKDFEEFLRGSILGLAKAAAGLIEQAFSVGALTPEWWVTVVGGQVTTTVAGGESTVIDHPGMLNIIVVAMIPLLMIFVAVQSCSRRCAGLRPARCARGTRSDRAPSTR